MKIRRELGKYAVAALPAALVCVMGCRGSVLNPESEMELRFDAANKISVPAERDQSMVIVATDAAEQGDSRVVYRALERIDNFPMHDQTAAQCAYKLVRAGDRPDANKIAQQIDDQSLRNETLRRLADSDIGSTDPAARRGELPKN